MSIGSVGGVGVYANVSKVKVAQPEAGAVDFSQVLASAASPAPAAATAGAAADPLEPHEMGPNDSLNPYLTSKDRAAFQSLYGVNFDPNGDVVYPASMGPYDRVAISAAAGQIASDRAHGRVSDSDVTPDYITQLVAGFKDKLMNDLPLFGNEKSSTNAIDVSA